MEAHTLRHLDHDALAALATRAIIDAVGGVDVLTAYHELHAGRPGDDVANQLGVDRATVYRWSGRVGRYLATLRRDGLLPATPPQTLSLTA